MAEVTVKPYKPRLVEVEGDPFTDTPAAQPSMVKLAGAALFGAVPTVFKPAAGQVYDALNGGLNRFAESFKEGFNKAGQAGLESMGTALENQYKPEGATGYTDAGEWIDKEGKVLPSQYRPNILPFTRGAGGIPEFAMPAMADVWNTLGGPAGLGAGPSLRPAMRQKVMKQGQPLFSGTPTLIPVDHEPEFE